MTKKKKQLVDTGLHANPKNKTVIRSRAGRDALDIFPNPLEYHRGAEATKKKNQLVDTTVPACKPQKRNWHSIPRWARRFGYFPDPS